MSLIGFSKEKAKGTSKIAWVGTRFIVSRTKPKLLDHYTVVVVCFC